jgi:hypothetical protein
MPQVIPRKEVSKRARDASKNATSKKVAVATKVKPQSKLTAKKTATATTRKTPNKSLNKKSATSTKGSLAINKVDANLPTASRAWELVDEKRIKYCHACATEVSFKFSHGDWICEKCGRTEDAAMSFRGSQKTTNDPSAVDGFLELGIKVALLISLFPFSLLFLVIFYGFDGAAQIIKDLLVGVLRSIFGLVFIAIGVYAFVMLVLLLLQRK